jgi:hypothetical protein
LAIAQETGERTAISILISQPTDRVQKHGELGMTWRGRHHQISPGGEWTGAILTRSAAGLAKCDPEVSQRAMGEMTVEWMEVMGGRRASLYLSHLAR